MNIRNVVLVLLTACGLSAYAQDSENMLNVTRTKSGVKDASLGQKGGAIFIAPNDAYVVNTSVRGEAECSTPKKVGNHYEYVLTLDVSKSRNRVFVVSRKGTPLSGKSKQVNINPGEYSYFTIEQPEMQLGVTSEKVNANEYFAKGLKPTDALIEINSTVKLNIQFSKDMGIVHHTAHRNGTYIDSLIINVNRYQELQDVSAALAKQTAEEEAKQSSSWTQQQWDAFDALKKKSETAAEVASGASVITLQGKGTNILPMNEDLIKKLRPKDKLFYGIMIAGKTDTIVKKEFQTQYAEMINQAESQKSSRDYALAQKFYENAANAKDASDADKSSALAAASKMGELAEFKSLTDAQADSLYALTKSNKNINKKAFTEFLTQIVERYETLHRETGDAFYKKEADRLAAEKENLGFILMGRFVMSEYKGGQLLETPISHVRIYGSQDSKNDDMEKRNYSGKGELITTITAPDGRYRITLKPGQYKTIIFEAYANSEIKVNKSVSVEGRTDDRNVKIRFPKD